MLYTVFVNSTIFGSTFPVIPEFQVYHTVGSRESTYTTGAIGLSLHLFDFELGTLVQGSVDVEGPARDG